MHRLHSFLCSASCFADDEEFDMPLPPPPTFEDLHFSREEKQSTFEKLILEVNNFDRKTLRPIDKQLKSRRIKLSLRERLNDELLAFDHAKLRHVRTREQKFPNIIFNGIRAKPDE